MFSRDRLLLLGLCLAALIAGVAIMVMKNKRTPEQQTMDNVMQDAVNKFKQQLKDLGLNETEVNELIMLNDKFLQAKNEFDVKQEELYKKSPEQLEQFIFTVSNTMMEYRFDDQNPAIQALMHEPVVANFIGAWKNVHTKERELEQKYPAFKEFVAKQQEEILKEIDNQLEAQEDIKE